MDQNTPQQPSQLPDLNNLPPGACLRGTIHVTRAATGKVDTFDIVLTPLPVEQQPQEN